MIENILRKKNNQTIFTITDIANFTEKEVNSNLISNINYYVKKKDLINLSKGLYALDMNYNRWELGNKLRRPSYISFYTILQKTGIIFQEYSTIYLAANRSEEIEISGVTYKYRKLKDEILLNSLGIESKDNMYSASPERALCDKLYLDGIEYFDNLKNINWDFMRRLNEEVYKSKKLNNIIQELTNVE